jgi:hypothetical protein
VRLRACSPSSGNVGAVARSAVIGAFVTPARLSGKLRGHSQSARATAAGQQVCAFCTVWLALLHPKKSVSTKIENDCGPVAFFLLSSLRRLLASRLLSLETVQHSAFSAILSPARPSELLSVAVGCSSIFSSGKRDFWESRLPDTAHPVIMGAFSPRCRAPHARMLRSSASAGMWKIAEQYADLTCSAKKGYQDGPRGLLE